jgi:hypothetical protein
VVSSDFTGFYRGVVHSNKDPLNQGRLKVRVKQLFGDTPTDWAWPVQLPSTTVQPPAVGQGVWVSFLGGNPSFPIWVGKYATEITDEYPWYISKVVPSEVTEEITDLLELRELANGKTEVDLTQTILNIVRNRYHGSFIHTGTQTAVLPNTAYAMPLNVVESSYGVSITGGNTIRIEKNGMYSIAFSAQLSASNSSEHEVNIWLRHQGVNVANSNSRVLFKGNTVAAWNFFVNNDTEPQDWQLMWSTPSTNVVSIASLPAVAPHPATPALIVTVNKVK